MYFRTGSYSSAESYAVESVALARKLAAANPDAYREEVAVALINLVYTRNKLKKYDSSEVRLLEALSIIDELAIKNPRLIPMRRLCLQSLAGYYDQTGRYDKAGISADESLIIIGGLAEDNPQAFSSDLIGALYKRGELYLHASKPDSAEMMFAETLKRAREASASGTSENWNLLPGYLSAIAWATRLSNLRRAVDYTLEAIETYLKHQGSDINVRPALIRNYDRMSLYMILSRRFDEAETYASKAEEYHEKKFKAKRFLAHALLYQGNYEGARKLYEEIKDTAWDDSITMREQLILDFDDFEKGGVTNPDVPKIRELLDAK
jgi:tetratricopeptide (TPR) repeat protein